MEPQAHQQPFFPGGGLGLSPFAAGSPQRQGSLGFNQHGFNNLPAGSMGYNSSPGQTSVGASPTLTQPALASAIDLLSRASMGNNDSYDVGPGGGLSGVGYGPAAAAATLAATGRQLSAGNAPYQLQFYQQQQQQQQQQQPGSGMGSPWRSLGRIDSGPPDATGFAPPPPPPPYSNNAASPLNRASTASAHQLLLQQQQQQLAQAALARSLSVDVGAMSASGAGALGSSGRWGSGFAGHDFQGRYGSVYDMKSLTSALSHVQAGTGDVRRTLAACTFRPRLPGLTKLVSQMSREGHWAKALEVYESLDAVGVRPDTTITNAAISACDKGGQWEKALQIFKSMTGLGMERDAITYSALISALSKGRQWGLAIDVFNHMVAEGVECDAVTCCSLITALDKGGQWQLAEQVFVQMYRHHPQFHVLLEGMDTDPGDLQGGNGTSRANSLLAGTFTTAALNALSISEDALPPPEQLLAMMEESGTDAFKPGSSSSNGGKDQTQKPPGGGDQGGTVAASGKSAGAGMPTLTTHNGPNTGNVNTPAAGNAASSDSASTATKPGSSDTAACSTNSTASNTPATDCAGKGSITGSSTGSCANKPDSQSAPTLDRQGSGPVRTLSCVWSKILASKAMANAQASCIDSNAAATAAGTANSSNRAAQGEAQEAQQGSSSWGSNEDSLLTASDAVVHLMPAGKFRLIDAKSNGYNAAAASGSSSSAPQLAPGTSAFAAAGASPLEPDHPTPASEHHQQPKPGGPPSPHRPPPHPVKHHSTAAASTATTGSISAAGPASQGSGGPQQQGLSPAGSLGLATSPGSASPARTGSGTLRLGLTRSLNSKKSSPNRVCCNALLAAYARATPPRWKQALKLLEVMWQCGGELVPDIVSYNTVMKACGNAQQTDKAFELYQHMQARGIEPTVATFGTLITIASEAQAYDRVKESWGWLQASGLPVHITCVNSYLTALIKEDNWDAAIDLFQQLKSNKLGVRPNSVTYNILMSACLARDRASNVKALFDEMTSANLSPTLISYNTLLHAYAKLGAWQDSLAVLHHMCTSSPVRPSTASFNTVFCTLTSVATLPDMGPAEKQLIAARALDVYGLMMKLPGLHPDSALYRTIIGTFSACAAPKVVLQMALIMVQQGHILDLPSASAALEALQEDGAWGLSGPILAACLDASVVLSPLLLQHILLVATQDKAWRVAKEVLQVTDAAQLLDAVAQLLQQTRTQLQAGSGGSQVPTVGLLPEAEALDELLFLTYLQAQYSNGGWEEGIKLFKQLQQNRGPTFAVCNGVLLGSLLELLVVRGGPQGTVEAIRIVDRCHATGVMSHFTPPPTSSAAGPSGSPSGPGAALGSNTSATAAGLLSPDQQQGLSWPLEAAGFGLGGSSSGFGGAPVGTSSAMSALGFSSGFDFSTGPGVGSSFGSGVWGTAGPAGPPAGPVPLSLLDVRGCSAVEALVLMLSWLGHVVAVVASGRGLSCVRLRIETGSVGPMDQLEARSLKLTYRVPDAAAAAQGFSGGSAAAAAPAAAGPGAGAASGPEGGSSSSSSAALPAAGPADEAPAGAEDEVSACAAAPGTTAAPEAVAAPSGLEPAAVLLPPAAAAAASSESAAHSRLLQVPGSNLSVHSVVLAVLSGQLSALLACSDPMELLVAFSAGGVLPLALLCLTELPVQLPNELQGGGVELDAVAVSRLVESALAASNVPEPAASS